MTNINAGKPTNKQAQPTQVFQVGSAPTTVMAMTVKHPHHDGTNDLSITLVASLTLLLFGIFPLLSSQTRNVPRGCHAEYPAGWLTQNNLKSQLVRFGCHPRSCPHSLQRFPRPITRPYPSAAQPRPSLPAPESSKSHTRDKPTRSCISAR